MAEPSYIYARRSDEENIEEKLIGPIKAEAVLNVLDFVEGAGWITSTLTLTPGPGDEPLVAAQDYQSAINMLLGYEMPQDDGYWYQLDETGIPRYKGRKLTDGEKSAIIASDKKANITFKEEEETNF